MRSVLEVIPVRFFALDTKASGILPRTISVRSPRNKPSCSAITITSLSLREPRTRARPFFRGERIWVLRFIITPDRVAHILKYCSTYCSNILATVGPTEESGCESILRGELWLSSPSKVTQSVRVESQAPGAEMLVYFSLATTNSGAHSRARLISESGKAWSAFWDDSAYSAAQALAASSEP